MPIHENLSKNLKWFREESKFSQTQLADYLGIDPSLVSRFEKGEREIPLPIALKVCDLFGIEFSDLLIDDPTTLAPNLLLAFRADGLEPKDLQAIGALQKVVKYYKQLNRV